MNASAKCVLAPQLKMVKKPLISRVPFCSGSNKSKGSVRFEFFTSAENLRSVRVRGSYIRSFEFGSVWFYMSSAV